MRERGLEPLWNNPLDPKSKNSIKSHFPQTLDNACNTLTVKGLWDFFMSAGVSRNQVEFYRHGHKMGTIFNLILYVNKNMKTKKEVLPC